MAKQDKEERVRRVARDTLDEFVTMETKPGGMLEVIDDKELLRKVEQTKTWNDGTIEQYTNRLDEIKQRVDEIRSKKRTEARNKLHNFLQQHRKPGGVLHDIRDHVIRKQIENDEKWNAGSISEYAEKYAAWAQFVRDESLRRSALMELCDFLTTTLKEEEILKEDEEKLNRLLNEIQSSVSGTTEEYKKVLSEIQENVARSKILMRQRLHRIIIGYIEAELQSGEFLEKTKEMLKTELKTMEGRLYGSNREYKNKLETLRAAVEQSRVQARRDAKTEVLNFIESELKHEMPASFREELRDELNSVKNWKNKTFQEFKEKLQILKETADQRKNIIRCASRDKLLEFVQSSKSVL